jgi:hypothetical protein
MTRYFETVSCEEGLPQNEGFRTLLAMSQLQTPCEAVLPTAPKLKGRKLLPLQVEGELLVIAS